MKLIDRIYTEWPFYGARRLRDELRALGYPVGRQRVGRLMRQMGLEALYPKPRLSRRCAEHKIYPYLLGSRRIERPGEVWCTDITYLPLSGSHVYLTVVMDWHSRYVISWRLSNSLDVGFCLEALKEALQGQGPPEIFNTDQGSQYTSESFTGTLKAHQVQISMNGAGRALDNRMVERLWRTVKYEDIYLKGYENLTTLRAGLKRYFRFYNERRRHQSLGAKTPSEIYFTKPEKEQEAA